MIGVIVAIALQIVIFVALFGKMQQSITDIRQDIRDIKKKTDSLACTNGTLFKHSSDNKARIARIEGRIGIDCEAD